MLYPISDSPSRPYRIWDAKEKTQLAHRYYAHSKKAHIGALIECRWAKVGTTLEVFNCTTGRLLGQYTRRVHTVDFLNGD